MTAKLPLFLAFGLVAGVASAQTAEEIVQKMDNNMTFKTRTADASLTVVRAGQSPDVRTLKIWGRNTDDSYTIFQSPARDKGVKYLKLAKSLHMYLPRTEKVVTISGHLLRESSMDSDFSYEDMLEARALLADYNASLKGEESVGGEACYVVELIAKDKSIAYYRRKLWISKKSFVALKMERYAESGLLLKTMTSGNIKEYNGRFYPLEFSMEDHMRKGSKTTFALSNVVFDAAISDAVFSRRNLMKAD